LEKAWQIRRHHKEESRKIIEGIMKSLSADSDEMRCKCYTVLGMLEIYANNLSEAKAYLTEADEYYKKHMDPLYYSRNSNNLGVLYIVLGDYNHAFTSLIEGLEISKANAIDEMSIYMIYNITEIYKNTGNYDKALSYLIEAEKINDKEEHAITGALLSSLALCYFETGEHVKAMEYVNTSIERASLSDDQYTLGLCYIIIAKIKFRSRIFDEAKVYCHKSMDARKNVNDLFAVANNYLLFAEIALEEKEYQEAVEYGEKAHELVKEMQSDAIISEIYSVLAKAYVRLNASELALKYYELLEVKQRELFNADLEKNLGLAAAEREIENIKKDAEIHRLNNIELKKKRDQLKLISNIGKSLVMALDFNEIISEIYNRLKQVVDLPILTLGVLNEEGDLVYRNIIQNNCMLPGRVLKFSENSLGFKAMSNEQTFYIPDLDDSSDLLIVDEIDEKPLHSLLFLPLSIGERVIGVMSFQSYMKHAYDSEIIELLEGLASYIAIAVENAHKTSIIQETAKTLKATIDELESTKQDLIRAETLASLGRLVSGVAHELNSPVGSGITLTGYAQRNAYEIEVLLKENKLGKQKLESFLNNNTDTLAKIESALVQTSEMIQNFKALAISESTLNRREISSNDLLTWIKASVHLLVKEHQVEMIDDIETFGLITYPEVLIEIIHQLVMNSVHHSFYEQAAPYVVNLSIKKTGAHVVIEYADNGMKIPGHIQPFIFEPFYGTRKQDGLMGIGLNAVHNMVTQILNGEITYQEKFYIRMPIGK
jgi:C4-dicarboxylate-specific signal transduction histidine kinase